MLLFQSNADAGLLKSLILNFLLSFFIPAIFSYPHSIFLRFLKYVSQSLLLSKIIYVNNFLVFIP
jgi:hypothetical protein